jgi:hypothetical protein
LFNRLWEIHADKQLTLAKDLPKPIFKGIEQHQEKHRIIRLKEEELKYCYNIPIRASYSSYMMEVLLPGFVTDYRNLNGTFKD